MPSSNQYEVDDDHHSSDQEQPFLDKKTPRRALRNLQNSRKEPYLLLYGAGLIIVVLGTWVMLLNSRLSRCSFKDAVYSPASHLLKPQNIVFETGFGLERTKYQGPPTPERDALWEDLYNFGVTQIPRSAAAQLVNKTVRIPNLPGAQYAVQLDVFHQLHCLNMIRKRLYSTEHYAPEHELMGMEHIEHCYDSLRQSLMCSVDVTPLPWQWMEEDQEAKAVAKVMHTCKDFEAVRRWARERQVAHFDRKVYVPDDLS